LIERKRETETEGEREGRELIERKRERELIATKRALMRRKRRSNTEGDRSGRRQRRRERERGATFSSAVARAVATSAAARSDLTCTGVPRS
jgi:hypothetical protein